MSSCLWPRVPGARLFFTVVLTERGPDLLTGENAARREAVRKTRAERPFGIDARVVLPDHLHCACTLSEGDSDHSMRWPVIKRRFSRTVPMGRGRPSHIARLQRGVWQRRFREYPLRSQEKYATYISYCHINPVKHGLVTRPVDWPYSTIHRQPGAT